MDHFTTARLLMVKNQILSRGIKDLGILHAMSSIPRENFIIPKYLDEAYSDSALPMGIEGQKTSQPFMIAYMLELLNITSQDKVLEIGTGSGYQTAVLSHCAREVVSLEINPQIFKFAENNLSRLRNRNITLINADGRDGYKANAPYDKIIVGAHTYETPTALLNQLKEGGMIVIPLGGNSVQQINTITKPKGEQVSAMIRQKRLACRFVPLA